ncbi:MAG: DUF3108 domain-containing protein, partial [Kiritimatiellae bacterium]|nr:DUF3108 domain-containing protein [Kiritimatiellia bacterium]
APVPAAASPAFPAPMHAKSLVLLLACAAIAAGTARAESDPAYEARKKAFSVRAVSLSGPSPAPSAEMLEALLPDALALAPAWDDPPPELWFPVGEDCLYEISWGVFTVGEARARADWLEVKGKRLLSISVEAESNGIVETLYPVKEFLQTLVEPVSFLPLAHEKQSSEGRHKTHELTVFDPGKHEAVYHSFLRDNGHGYEVPEGTRDMLSLMYWFRRDPMREPGEKRAYGMVTNEKLYELFVDSLKRETVKVGRYGKRDCIKLEPTGKFEGMFVRKGRMFLWVSRDARYTLCALDASVPVADIHVKLKEVRGPGDDDWTAPPENGKTKKVSRRHRP